jgi:RHS repeat-associated protein
VSDRASGENTGTLQGWCVDATGPTADSLQNEPVVSEQAAPYAYSAALIPNLALRLAVWLLTYLTPDTETPETPNGTPPTGEVWTSYYYAGGQRIAMRVQDPASTTDTNAVYYPLTDHLGSTSVTADENGAYYSELRYKPWGETRWESANATPTDFTYTGQKSDEGIGLMYYNARYYDSALGRFTNADTIVPGIGNPQNWDRFGYANNAPIVFSDPTGHASCEDMPWECEMTGPYESVLDWVEGNSNWRKDHLRWFILRFFDLRYTRSGEARYALKEGVESLDAMTAIVGEAARIYGEDWNSGILPALSELFIGVPSVGFGTLREARDNQQDNYGNAPLPFTASGFHSDYSDPSNQV